MTMIRRSLRKWTLDKSMQQFVCFYHDPKQCSDDNDVKDNENRADANNAQATSEECEDSYLEVARPRRSHHHWENRFEHMLFTCIIIITMTLSLMIITGRTRLIISTHITIITIM